MYFLSVPKDKYLHLYKHIFNSTTKCKDSFDMKAVNSKSDFKIIL